MTRTRHSLRRLGLALGALLVLSLGAVGCQTQRNSVDRALSPAPENSLRLATYNVHYILTRKTKGRWGLSGWEARKGPLDATVKAIGADIIAFQEMESFAGRNDDSENLARDWLLSQNPGYRAAAVGDWRAFPSTQPIFYRADRFILRDQGWFFFSETPDVIYSRTFNGSYPAFASWARFEDHATGAAFRVVNVHFDYASRENRRKSADLVARRIGPWIEGGETVFVAGDLNARLGSGLHDRLGEAGLLFVPVSGASYHMDRGLNLFGAIDHIGHSAEAEPVGAPVVYQEKLGAVWPTDHYPVLADFNLNPR